MATKTAKAKPEEVGVMFKAPHEIRGSIRSISAWAEMNDVRINGRVPAEKDIWAWLAASLYQSGEENWRDALTSGAKDYERAMTLLTEAIGDLPADQVTPSKFMAMRDTWVKRGASVRTVNKHHNQTLAAFRWGVTVEIIPSSVWHALQAVPRLKPNRTTAKPPKTIDPVTWAQVESIKGYVRPQVWAIIMVQWHTGMRSGEVLAMTPGQIVEWVYRPGKHKNAWRGHVREIPIGPKCREILTEWMEGKAADDKIFGGYTPQSYGRAVARACHAAKVAHWHPHQIRHSFASRVRESHGLDAAQAVLGHKTARVTEIYAARSTGLAKSVTEDIG